MADNTTGDVVVDVPVYVEAPQPTAPARMEEMPNVLEGAFDRTDGPWLPRDWATRHLPQVDQIRSGKWRFDMLQCKAHYIPCDFVSMLVLCAGGLVLGAFALPFVLVMLVVDVISFAVLFLPLTVLLTSSFLSSPQFGPNIKVLALVFIPLVSAISLGVYYAVAPIAAVFLALGLGFMFAFGDVPLPLWPFAFAAASGMEMMLTSPHVLKYSVMKSRELAIPLEPGQERRDIALGRLVRNVVVTVCGAILGAPILLIVSVLCAAPAFLSAYRLYASMAWKELTPTTCCIASPLLLLAFALCGPVAVLAMLVVPVVIGLFSGAIAISESESNVAAEWWNIITSSSRRCFRLSFSLLIHGDIEKAWSRE